MDMIGKIVALCAGAILLSAGCWLLLATLRRRLSWASGEGVIVGYRLDGPDGGSFPKVQFSLPSGVQVTFDSPSSGSPDDAPIGSQVRVLYPPTAPSNAMLLSFSSLWLFPIVFIGFGLGLISVGIKS